MIFRWKSLNERAEIIRKDLHKQGGSADCGTQQANGVKPQSA